MTPSPSHGSRPLQPEVHYGHGHLRPSLEATTPPFQVIIPPAAVITAPDEVTRRPTMMTSQDGLVTSPADVTKGPAKMTSQDEFITSPAEVISPAGEVKKPAITPGQSPSPGSPFLTPASQVNTVFLLANFH